MNIEVKVDKRTELLGILLLISDYNKPYPNLLEVCNNEEYRNKIFTKFSKFKQEKAVILLNEIINTLNFCYDAPVSLILQLNEDFTFDKLDDFPFYSRLDESQLVIDFLKELPAFAKKINFEEYYNNNLSLYNEITTEVKEKSNVEDIINFINKFYKVNLNKNFIINLMPYTTNGNFSTFHNNNLYSNLGVKPSKNASMSFIPYNDCGGLMLHEFCHYIVNPLTDKYAKFKKSYFKDIWTEMKKQAYGHVPTIINEHILRAVDKVYLNHYINTKQSKQYAKDEMKYEIEKDSFIYLPDLTKDLEEYYFNLDKYKNFEEFYPTLLKRFEQHIIKHNSTIATK